MNWLVAPDVYDYWKDLPAREKIEFFRGIHVVKGEAVPHGHAILQDGRGNSMLVYDLLKSPNSQGAE